VANYWDNVGTPQGRRIASRVLVSVGCVLLCLAAVAVVTYRTFLDTETFAAGVNEIRKTEVVSNALAAELTDQIVAGRPDLVAVQPLIEQVSAEVARSDLLSPVVERAAAQAQQAATREDSAAIVLRLADAGAVATSALRTFVPDLAEQIPPDLSVTLARVGAQDVFAGVLRAARYLSIAAWGLPVLALGTLAMGIWIAPNQRRGLVRAATGTLIAGGLLGAVTLVGGLAVSALDSSTLTGALAEGAWQVWSRGFWVASGVLLVSGALVGAAASALLPDLDIQRVARSTWRRAISRPRTTEGLAVRGVLVSLVGIGLVVDPLLLLRWGGVLVGLAVLAYGVSEVTDAAVRARRGEPESAEQPGVAASDTDTVTTGWSLGVLVAAVAVVLGAASLWIVQSVQTRPAVASGVVVGEAEVCNGHADLCERTYDQVAYVTTHNAMSAADQPGWFLAEQPHGVIAQLDGGARALMIDVWRARPAGDSVSSLAVDQTQGRQQLQEAFGADVVDAALRVVEGIIGPPTGPPALYLCHGLCEIGATELAPTLAALRVWLDANPDEVVTLIVENHVPAADVGAAVVQAGLEPYLHTPQVDTWPTLREMITSGRRLVVLTEEGSGGADHPWLANAFALTQDTPYTFPTAEDFTCESNRGAEDAPLFLVNHWLSGFTNLVSAAEQVNTRDVLGARVAQCAAERDRFPTFVGVNYYTAGDVREVVAELNGVSSDS
jgi:hypothetical protein